MAVVSDLGAVNREVIDIMERHYGERLDQIILFGSYARGDYHEDSDVDYLILLNDEHVSSFREVTTTSAARNAYYLDTFIHISATVISRNQFLTSKRIFYRQVKKDGKCIYERRLESLRQESRSVLS